MPIAPVTGMLRKHLLTHLSVGMGGGLVAGYTYWYTLHLPKTEKRDQWYLEQQAAKQ